MDPINVCYVIAAVASLGFGLVVTPVVRAIARRINLVDKPDGDRKMQAHAIALGGGIAVFASTVLAIGVVGAYAQWMDVARFGSSVGVFLWSMLAASTACVALGVLDDRVALRGRYKLAGQVVVVAILVASGMMIRDFTVFGVQVDLGWFAIPFTIFWLLGATNAINLIDGIDGLAASVGVVLCLSLAAINIWIGARSEAIIMLALAGAQLGFLRYNFNPASIYLGDAGSMLIGLVIGAVAIQASIKAPTAIALSVPLAVWSVPILDSFAAILRRKLTGRSVFSPDRGHFHHSLLVRGWTVRQASLFIALICATTGLGAVLSFAYGREWIALVTVLFVVAFLVFTETFGHIEFALLKKHFHAKAQSLYQRTAPGKRFKESAVRLQGTRDWGKIWAALVESAEGYGLVRIKLSISIPKLHEAYFADWEVSGSSAKLDQTWSIRQPLMLDGVRVGKLELWGVAERGEKSAATQMVQVLEFLEPLEEDIRAIRDQPLPDSPPETPAGRATPAPPAYTGVAPDPTASGASVA